MIDITKKWAKKHGYFGLAGGWIYHSASPSTSSRSRTGWKPICQGWANFYRLYRPQIDYWWREQEFRRLVAGAGGTVDSYGTKKCIVTNNLGTTLAFTSNTKGSAQYRTLVWLRVTEAEKWKDL